MLSRSHDSTVDLDLELARRESSENPVYYVQYAHARIHSVLAKAGEERVAAALGRQAHPDELHESERELVRKLLAFPDEVAEAAERRGPHRIAGYAQETAKAFHQFYKQCHVIGAEPAVERSRLAICRATAQVMATALDLVGVEAPDSM
jgi:arginyl-tRNA synthetase